MAYPNPFPAEGVCGICMSDMEPQPFDLDVHNIRRLNYSVIHDVGDIRDHTFHRMCILEWISDNGDHIECEFPPCPLCSSQIRALMAVNFQNRVNIVRDCYDPDGFLVFSELIPEEDKQLLREEFRLDLECGLRTQIGGNQRQADEQVQQQLEVPVIPAAEEEDEGDFPGEEILEALGLRRRIPPDQ